MFESAIAPAETFIPAVTVEVALSMSPMTDGLAEPILSSGKGDFFYGPGHNGEIFTSADGRDYIFYHAHARNFKPEQRPTLLQELLWDDEGWPRFKDGRPQKTVRRP